MIPISSTQKEMPRILDDLPLWSAPFGLKLLEKIPMRTGMSVLDIGCGAGFPLIELAMRLGNKSRLTGLDPSQEFLDRAAEKMMGWELTNTQLVCGVAEQMPFEKHRFDLIISNNGLNNVQNLPAALSEIKRVGKPGAELFFTMNTGESMLNFYRILEDVLVAAGLSHRVEFIRKHIIHKRPPGEYLLECLQQADIHPASMEHDSFCMRYSDGTAFLQNGFIRLAFLPSWLEIAGNEKAEEVLGRLETSINKQSEVSGEFKIEIPYTLYSCTL